MRWRRLVPGRGVLAGAAVLVAFVIGVVFVDNGRSATTEGLVDPPGIFEGQDGLEDGSQPGVENTTSTLPRTTTTRVDPWLSNPLTVDTSLGLWRWTRVEDYQGPEPGLIVQFGDEFIGVDDNSEAFWTAQARGDVPSIDGTAWILRSPDGVAWSKEALDERFSAAHLWMSEAAGMLWMTVRAWGDDSGRRRVWRSTNASEWNQVTLREVELPIEGLEVSWGFEVAAVLGDIVIAPTWVHPQVPSDLWENEYGPGAEPDWEAYWEDFNPDRTAWIVRAGKGLAEVRFERRLDGLTAVVEVVEVLRGDAGEVTTERVIHTGRATYTSLHPDDEIAFSERGADFPAFFGTWLSNDGGATFEFRETGIGHGDYGSMTSVVDGGFIAIREGPQRYITTRVSESTTITSLVAERDLVRSEDGLTWEVVGVVDVDAPFWLPIAVQADGTMVAANDEGVMRSEDGTTWAAASAPPPGAQGAEYRAAPFGFIGLVHETLYSEFVAHVSADGDVWTSITPPPTPRAYDTWAVLAGDTLFWVRGFEEATEVWIGRFE